MSERYMHLLLALVAALSLVGCEDDPIGEPYVAIGLADAHLTPFTPFFICPDGKGNVYAAQTDTATGGIVLSYRAAGGGWTVQALDMVSRYGTDGRGNEMKATPDGSVWLVGLDEAARLSGGQVVQRVLLPQWVNIGEFEVYGNQMWMIDNTGQLYRTDASSNVFTAFTCPISGGPFTHITIDSQGNKWMTRNTASSPMIGLMANGTWVRPDDPDSLMACQWCGPPTGTSGGFSGFNVAYSDNAGNSYFYRGGDGYLVRNTAGLLSAEISPTIGNYWVETDSNGHPWRYGGLGLYGYVQMPVIDRIEGGALAESFNLRDALDGNVWVYDLAFDRGNNNAWIATNLGIVVYNTNGVCL